MVNKGLKIIWKGSNNDFSSIVKEMFVPFDKDWLCSYSVTFRTMRIHKVESHSTQLILTYSTLFAVKTDVGLFD